MLVVVAIVEVFYYYWYQKKKLLRLSGAYEKNIISLLKDKKDNDKNNKNNNNNTNNKNDKKIITLKRHLIACRSELIEGQNGKPGTLIARTIQAYPHGILFQVCW